MSRIRAFATSTVSPAIRGRAVALAIPALSVLEILVSGLTLVVVLLLIVNIPAAGAT